MDQRTLFTGYTEILKAELVPALGCTEPIALAYAAAKARAVLGAFPDHLHLQISGNIVKNVKGVAVPNAGGMKGVKAAGVLGVVGGNPELELKVLQEVTEEHRQKTKELLEADFCTVELIRGQANLDIIAQVTKGQHSALIEILHNHTNIVRMEKDGESFIEVTAKDEADHLHHLKETLRVKDILDYAENVPLEEVRDIIELQIQCNSAISQEGMQHSYGMEVGRNVLEFSAKRIADEAKARAAAGSDARMGGCAMPVVINSGSGNQGLTTSLPVLEYARHLGISHEETIRALLISNLVSIHIKTGIGKLSAFCGAVSAACGSGAAITWMYDKDYDKIAATIINTAGNVGGIICDGAKASCAAKIASSVDAAILGHNMAMKGYRLEGGDGIIKDDVEGTIANIARLGREGMRETDEEILHMMLED